jgi:competence protein ComFC
MKAFAKIGDFLGEMLFPKHFKCVFCECELPSKNPSLTCALCNQNLPYIGEKFCEICGEKLNSLATHCLVCKNRQRQFDLARAPFLYEGMISNAIVKFKFQNARYLFEPLSTYLAKCYYENQLQADVVVCVPMTEQKQVQRGYNQAEQLAKHFAAYTNLAFEPSVLKKIKNTQNQVDLSFEQRANNVKGAYFVTDRTKVKNKTVVLVDDVLTTGATAEECAKLLKKAGAKKVFVLCLARTSVQEQKN